MADLWPLIVAILSLTRVPKSPTEAVDNYVKNPGLTAPQPASRVGLNKLIKN